MGSEMCIRDSYRSGGRQFAVLEKKSRKFSLDSEARNFSPHILLSDPCCCAHFSLGASRSRAASCSLGRHFCGVQRFASPLAGELLARSHEAAAAPRSANKFVSATERYGEYVSATELFTAQGEGNFRFWGQYPNLKSSGHFYRSGGKAIFVFGRGIQILNPPRIFTVQGEGSLRFWRKK